MVKVCLDKTIRLTRGLMNGEVKTPEFVKVCEALYGISTFRFVDSKVEIPIEHLGLAVLSYQNAVEQYTFKSIEKDATTGEKTETVKFEPLIGTGVHISDFLNGISSDALNWYFGFNGPYKMERIGGSVRHKDTTDFKQCKIFNEKGEDLRELAITEAYRQAVRGYVANTIEGMEDSGDVEFVTGLHDFMEQDALNFQSQMDELQLESAKLIISPEKQAGDDKSAQPPLTEDAIASGIDGSDMESLIPETIRQQIPAPETSLEGQSGNEGDFVLPDSSM